MKRKINLISTLVHRALVICLESTLQNELFNIRTIVINNGFPKAVINTVITKKMNQFRRPTQLGPKKCPVHLHSPWLGNVSMKHEMQIKTAVVILQLNHALSTPGLLKLWVATPCGVAQFNFGVAKQIQDRLAVFIRIKSFCNLYEKIKSRNDFAVHF